jgi:hypothetical protein
MLCKFAASQPISSAPVTSPDPAAQASVGYLGSEVIIICSHEGCVSAQAPAVPGADASWPRPASTSKAAEL